MQLVRSPSQFPFDKVAQGSVVTIGAFDGLHLGHQRLLKRVVREAKDRRMTSVVMSFEPIPTEFFSAEHPPARLMRFREKYEALKEFGIDIFFCPRFNSAMRNIRADEFLRHILIHTLNMRYIEIGDDFRFAKNREGNVEMLKRVSKALDYQVEQAGSVVVDEERVSSTAVRDALWKGELDRATRLLGRHYRMSGTIVEGHKLGRTLGYPTANIGLHRRQSPVMGVFAVRVHGLGAEPLDAVAVLVRDRLSTVLSRCLKCICSTSTRISTGVTSKWILSRESAIN